jgi:acetylornithine/LysW-gamma-L-lysine aminotransferase
MVNTFDTEDKFLAPLFQKFNVSLVRGKDEYVWDEAGKRYIDCMAGYGVAIAGHCNEWVVEAVKKQVERLITCHGSFYNDARAEFLEVLSSVVPKKLDSFILTNSGAESVEAAIKLARKKTGRKKIVSMKGGFHGKTMGALSATWNKKYKTSFEPLLEKFVFADFGNAESVEKLVDSETAAVIAEPIQGEAGVIIPTPEFLKNLREICDKNGSLLILDEIQTGLGRTGKMWAFEHSNILPDIMTVAKGIAGGIPAGCVITSKEISSCLSRGEHTSTFAGNPVACAAGKALLEFLTSNKLPERAFEMGKEVSQRLKKLKESHLIVRDVRSIGLMIAVETRFDVYSILKKALSNGFIFGYSGRETIRMLPPLIIQQSNIDEAFNLLDRILGEEENERLGQNR